MTIIKASFPILIGVLFGAGSAIALSPAFAAFTMDQDSITPMIMMSLVLLCGIICFFAPTIRRSFGRGFLLLGASVFAAVGAGIAGVAVTGVATFIGVILAQYFLLTGLILSLGGRREVVMIEGSSRREPTIQK